MKNRKYLAGISANVLLLGIASFFNDVSSEMIMPILPLFITALGTFHTMIGLMALPASLIAGFLWTISQQATFMYGAVVSLASVILFLAFRRHFR